MEILDNLITKLKEFEESVIDYGGSDYKDVIFPIRRLAEAEKIRQLKEGTRIKVNPLFYACPYCSLFEENPETFFKHMLGKHICPPEEVRKQIDEQQQAYQDDVDKLEELICKYTEVLLDVDYTDEIRNT